MDATSFAGKVAIVTGGGSGIGRATAMRLGAGGANVIVADVNEEGGNATAREIGGSARFVRTDVTNRDDVAALVAACEGRLDIAFNKPARLACSATSPTPTSTSGEAWSTSTSSACTCACAPRSR